MLKLCHGYVMAWQGCLINKEGAKPPAPSLTGKRGTHPYSLVWKWPPFLQQNTDFSTQNDPFFSPKWTPFLAVKTLTFQPKRTPVHGKTLDFKINPFFSKFKEVSTKITPFSRKMRILAFLKKIPLYSLILELGCVW